MDIVKIHEGGYPCALPDLGVKKLGDLPYFSVCDRNDPCSHRSFRVPEKDEEQTRYEEEENQKHQEKNPEKIGEDDTTSEERNSDDQGG
jgi:hypothetical protein